MKDAQNNISLAPKVSDIRSCRSIVLQFSTCSVLEAIHNGFTDIAQLLIDSKCDVNLTDRLHQAPIHLAIAKGQPTVCKKNIP